MKLIQMIVSKNILTILCLYFFMFGCSINEDGILRDHEGNILSATELEIAETQHTLLKSKTPKDLPKSAEGGVLFDGKVVSVNITNAGLYITSFEIDKVILGDLKEKNITIYSPSPDKTGIDFREGEIYRVYAMFLEDKYRTWDWLGTVKLIKE